MRWRVLLESILFYLRVDRFAPMDFASFVSCVTTQFASMDSKWIDTKGIKTSRVDSNRAEFMDTKE